MHHVHGPDSDALVSFCLGSCEGDIYTWTGPELRNVSEVNAFQRSVGWLHSPPGKKWISASEMHEHILPKTVLL